jgi:hypothetical protein
MIAVGQFEIRGMLMARDSEKLFAADLASYLTTELQEELEQNSLEVVPSVKILADLTCSIESDGTGNYIMQPKLSFLEQDIVIGHRAETPTEIRKFFSNIRNRQSILVPRLVIEVKYEGVTSHVLMTYSEIAGRLKGVYQNLRYYFLMRAGSKDPWTLERHGRNFDRIYQFVRARGSKSRYWPGAYQIGQLAVHLQDPIVGPAVQKLVEDIRIDLGCPRVRTTKPM